jgi:PAS domain S-box-containing protein
MAKPSKQPQAAVGHAGLASASQVLGQHAVIDMTPSGTVTGWNPAAALLYGYQVDEIVGRAADVLCLPEGRAAEADILHRVLTDRQTERYEAARVCKDGTVITVSVTAAPIIDTAGDITGTTAVSWKVSPRRGTEDQAAAVNGSDAREAQERFEVRTGDERRDAREAQERFEVRTDTERRDARDAQERFDVRTGDDRVDARDAQERFDVKADADRVDARGAQEVFDIRVDAERREGREAQERFDVRTGDDRRDARDAQERFDVKAEADRVDARGAQEVFDIRVDAERREGREAQERFDVRTGDERRDARRARELSERRDALERKERMQAQLQQAQRLENLGQLAGGVAHDFNNLLAIILNYTAFVSEELTAPPRDDWPKQLESARNDLGQVMQAVEQAARLTRQLLAFARRGVIRPQVLDLDTVVTGVEEMLHRTIGDHIELVITLGGNLWPILADPGKLEQILVNLAVNARDAMPAGGTLTIDTSNITVDADTIAGGSKAQPGRNVRLRVGDTGGGMTADVIEHVFEPFFTTKEEGAGTGLGLATVYGIVGQADGDIQIYSEPGIGTTFSIMLPVTAEVATAPVAAAVPCQRTPNGETVLVVENQDALREVTKRIFTRNGYQVITAANGLEALDIARGHPGDIHLLLTDVVMPRMHGMEVAEKVRVIKPGIEVLFMSGYAQPVLTSLGRLDPNVALVEKPFSAADLLAKAGHVLNVHFPPAS